MNSTYEILCDLVESKNPILLGQHWEILPKIMKVVVEVFQRKWRKGKEDLTCRHRLVSIVKMVMNNVPLSLQCMEALTQQQVDVLHDIIKQ